MFNLDYYSDEVYFHLFQFKDSAIGKILSIVGWKSGKIVRFHYCADNFTEVHIMLRKLYFPTRWTDIKKKFGIHTSALSEVF